METDRLESVDDLVENEYYIVRHSGETPEIAYNSAIYFLERAQDGPGLVLSYEQRKVLQAAAVDRWQEIVLRDMDHENVGRSIYRGIARSMCNYERFVMFCKRQNIDPEPVKRNAAHDYSAFLERELHNLSCTDAQCVVNTSFEELQKFASILGIEFLPQYHQFRHHCLLPE